MRRQQLAENLSRRISPELYQSVIALSYGSIARLNLPSRSQPAPLCSPLLPYHFALPLPISESAEVAARAIWLGGTPGGRGKTANGMAATFMPLSGRRHRYISLCSSLFRLLNYIPINNALPTLPAASLFTIPSAAPREDSPSPGSRQIVAFIISARDPRSQDHNGPLRRFAFSTNE